MIRSWPDTQRNFVGRHTDPEWNADPFAFRHFEQWQRMIGEIRPVIS